MTAHSRDKIIYMANQIARNLATEANPPAAVVAHIRAFWAPSMCNALIEGGGDGLEDIAFQARNILLEKARARDDG